MTLSPEKRAGNADAALKRILDEIGNGCFDDEVFDTDDPAFAAIFPTTWDQLLSNKQIFKTEATGRASYSFCLTASGWIAALAAAGGLEIIKPEAGRLSGALKDSLTDRGERVEVPIFELVSRSNLTESWIRNAIDAGLLQHLWVEKFTVSWSPRDKRKELIIVPRDFGVR